MVTLIVAISQTDDWKKKTKKNFLKQLVKK